jgi:hypothetical protein
VILAIDPGTEQSAWVLYDGALVRGHGYEPNEKVLFRLREGLGQDDSWLGQNASAIVIESVESYGMAVGKEVFSTVHWAGRFYEAAEYRCGVVVHQLPRKAVKIQLCQSVRATDSNIRMALLDRFGGGLASVGTKKNPGPLHGIKSHLWAALALAVTWAETHPNG